MCGVFGFAGKLTRREWALAHRLMAELAIASEDRGTDAVGFGALTSGGELLWQRQPGPAGAPVVARRAWPIAITTLRCRSAAKSGSEKRSPAGPG